MKVQLLSDLHLEHAHRFPPFTFPVTSADVVVLAGDIDNGTRSIDWAEQMFPDQTVLYVPGNHEYYDGELATLGAALKVRGQRSANVRVLDNDTLVLGGVRFIGSTLWTDFELHGADRVDAVIEQSLKQVVDFRAIRLGSGLLTPRQTIDLHREAVSFLGGELAKPFSGKTVVITHHAPHPNSVHARWTGNVVNPAFVSDLTRLMGKSAWWFHGHTHDSFDFSVQGTRVIANPMGYRTSNWREARISGAALRVVTENRCFDPALVLEI